MACRLFLFALLLPLYACHAQITPAPGAKLNYTQVMFEYGQLKGADAYLVQVAEDTPGASFDHCLVEQRDSSTATLITGFEFGKKYIWRYTGISKGKTQAWQGPYAFEVVIDDTTWRLGYLGLSVTVNDSSANAGGLIANDATHTIVDRSGKMVWYLPGIDWTFRRTSRIKTVRPSGLLKQKIDIKPYLEDIKMNPYGTITYLTDSTIAECDLSGKILWGKHDAPPVSDIGEEDYNHVFTRLPNGHYLVLGGQQWRKMPDDCNPQVEKKYRVTRVFDNTEYAQVEFGTIIEYDKKGNVVWTWSSRDYLDSNPMTPMRSDPLSVFLLKAHVNALSTDRNNEFLYMGFRDISRIIKIEKKTGKVVDSWGARMPAGIAPMHELPFHKQHDACVLDDGDIAVYNNNDHPGRSDLPGVVIFSQKPENSGQIVWQYDCDLPSEARRKSRTGGNVEQLKNGNLLVCMGTNDIVFEITPDKKIVWQMKVSTLDKPDFEYTYRLYRAHYLSSLYPCYFTFVTEQDAEQKRSSQFTVRIFNKGSEPDAYHLMLSSPSGDSLAGFATGTVAAGQSVSVKIRKSLVHGRKAAIKVWSDLNPDLERKRLVAVSR